MARQCKEGLDYFPLNIDMDEEDERVYMMEAKFGEKSFTVLIKLLMTIYRNGYYYPWTEREQIFFSRKKNIDMNYCIQIVDFLLHSGFLCKHLFDKYGLLTSRGIQKRYFSACVRRKQVLIIKELLLIDLAKDINVSINSVYVDINSINVSIMSTSSEHKSDLCQHDVSNNSQRKGKERKGEESKGNESKVKERKLVEKPEKPEQAPFKKAKPDDGDPVNDNGSKTRDQQLVEMAKRMKTEDPGAYKTLMEQHPEIHNAVNGEPSRPPPKW